MAGGSGRRIWRGGKEAVMGDGVRSESGCEGMGSGSGHGR